MVSAQILQIFACGAIKIAYKMRTESTKIPKFSLLRRASCAAGDFFSVSGRHNGDFTLQNRSAAGGFFVVSGRFNGDFTLQNERAAGEKNCSVRALQRGIYLAN